MRSFKSPLTLFACLACLTMASCSNETDSIVQEVTTEDNATSSTQETPQIKITVNQANSSVIYSREYQTSNEKAVKTLNFYIFKLGSDNSTYYYYNTYTLGNTSSSSTTTGTSTTYSINIPLELIGETIKVYLIANDAVSGLTTTTTESTFLTSLATASVSTGDNVDVLVGDPTSTAATGYPMSATAYVSSSSTTNEVKLTTSGATMTANLVRTMARVDIKNYVSNLTVTDVYVYNTPNASYLLEQSTTTPPTSASNITLKAYSAYYNSLGIFTEGNDTSCFSTDSNTGIDWMKHVLYMYEQCYDSSDSSSYPTIYISYTITYTDDSSTKNSENGQVAVPFTKKVQRNYLYTIKLGLSSSSDTEKAVEISYNSTVSASFEIDEWDDGGTISTTLDPSSTTE